MSVLMNNASRAADGKFRDAKWDRLCTCGHTLGAHLAEGDRECIAHETGDAAEQCTCTGYKRATAGK